VFTDHAGFDTWDSMRRAKRVFEARDAIVVRQASNAD
jgi:SanA protein